MFLLIGDGRTVINGAVLFLCLKDTGQFSFHESVLLPAFKSQNKATPSVTSSLFDLYKDNLVNDASALRRYKSLCGNKLLKLPALSNFTKMVYLLPIALCHRILLLKGKK